MKERKLLEQQLEGQSSTALMAVDDGKSIGAVQLMRSTR